MTESHQACGVFAVNAFASLMRSVSNDASTADMDVATACNAAGSCEAIASCNCCRREATIAASPLISAEGDFFLEFHELRAEVINRRHGLEILSVLTRGVETTRV
jgi:hypothetical protein